MEGGEIMMRQKIDELYMEYIGFADYNRYDDIATQVHEELMEMVTKLVSEDSEEYRALEFKISLLMASCEYSGFASAVKMME